MSQRRTVLVLTEEECLAALKACAHCEAKAKDKASGEFKALEAVTLRLKLAVTPL